MTQQSIGKRWSRHSQLLRRLRKEEPSVLAIPDEELEPQIEDAVKAARVLAIVKPEHVYRFVRLRYREADWQRPGVEAVLQRVLTDTSIDAELRLAFVETLAERPSRWREREDLRW